MKLPSVIRIFAILSGVSISAQTLSLYQQGLVALEQNRPAEAVMALTAAEQENPRNAAIRNFRGFALAQLGRQDAAAGEYREAIRLNPRMEGSLGDVEQEFAQARRFLKSRAASDALNDLPPFLFRQGVLPVYRNGAFPHLIMCEYAQRSGG